MDFVCSKTDELDGLQAWLESWIFTAAKVLREKDPTHLPLLGGLGLLRIHKDKGKRADMVLLLAWRTLSMLIPWQILINHLHNSLQTSNST